MGGFELPVFIFKLCRCAHLLIRSIEIDSEKGFRKYNGLKNKDTSSIFQSLQLKGLKNAIICSVPKIKRSKSYFRLH